MSKYEVSLKEDVGNIVYSVVKNERDRAEVLQFFLECFLKGKQLKDYFKIIFLLFG